MTVRRFFLATAAALALAAASAFAAEDPRAGLTPGDYQAGPDGCARPSGAGYMNFDGANWSGDAQLCRAHALGADRYRLTCVSTRGGIDGKPFSAGDFDKVPEADRDVVDLTITITGPKSFTIGKTPYDLCKAAR